MLEIDAVPPLVSCQKPSKDLCNLCTNGSGVTGTGTVKTCCWTKMPRCTGPKNTLSEGASRKCAKGDFGVSFMNDSQK